MFWTPCDVYFIKEIPKCDGYNLRESCRCMVIESRLIGPPSEAHQTMTQFVRGPFGSVRWMEAAQWTVIAEVRVLWLEAVAPRPIGAAREVWAIIWQPMLGRVNMKAAFEMAQE